MRQSTDVKNWPPGDPSHERKGWKLIGCRPKNFTQIYPQILNYCAQKHKHRLYVKECISFSAAKLIITGLLITSSTDNRLHLPYKANTILLMRSNVLQLSLTKILEFVCGWKLKLDVSDMCAWSTYMTHDSASCCQKPDGNLSVVTADKAICLTQSAYITLTITSMLVSPSLSLSLSVCVFVCVCLSLFQCVCVCSIRWRHQLYIHCVSMKMRQLWQSVVSTGTD